MQLENFKRAAKDYNDRHEALKDECSQLKRDNLQLQQALQEANSQIENAQRQEYTIQKQDKLMSMLQESHKSLIRSNDSLIEELAFYQQFCKQNGFVFATPSSTAGSTGANLNINSSNKHAQYLPPVIFGKQHQPNSQYDEQQSTDSTTHSASATPSSMVNINMDVGSESSSTLSAMYNDQDNSKLHFSL